MAAVLEAHAAGLPIALRTSGTTGRPRAVVRTTGSWVGSFEHVTALTGLGAGSRLWLPGPLAATMNLFAATLARWVGATLVPEPAGATHAHLTPTALLRALDDAAPVGGVHLTVAGDRLDQRVRERAEAAGAQVSHYYGASELSFVAWGPDAEELRAFPGVELDVRSGEIWVRSPYLCTGYDGAGPLRRDEDGFATVGDRGRLADGVLTVAGRGRDAVVTGGATILVSDVETALSAGLAGSLVVVGVPHPSLGQVVAAALTDAGDLEGAHRVAESRLAPAARPRRWFHVRSLPETGAGKVDRDAVAELVTRPDVVRLVPRRAPLDAR